MGLVNNCDAMMIFLVWITVTQMIMELHFRLFKRGVFYNHMQCRDEARKRFACFEFCRGAESNPAAKALDAIGAMLFDPEGEGRTFEASALPLWRRDFPMAFGLDRSSADFLVDGICPLLASVVLRVSAVSMEAGAGLRSRRVLGIKAATNG